MVDKVDDTEMTHKNIIRTQQRFVIRIFVLSKCFKWL
jgi:hypothetical protein